MAKLPSPEDFEISINNAPLIKTPLLKGGHVEKINDVVICYVGGFCIVFPYYISTRKVAVRCWFANVSDAQKRSKIIADYLHEKKLPYFVDFDYIESALATNEGLQPVVIMDWVRGDTLKEYLGKNIDKRDKLLQLAENFKKMSISLHKNNISHGDLQHGNIMVNQNDDLILVDYDSLFVPGLDGFSDDIKGLLGYQHPARKKSKTLSKKNDYFSELIIYTSIMALAYYPNLWMEKQIGDTETLLFSVEDIETNGNAEIFTFLKNDKRSNGLLPRLATAIKEELKKASIEDLLPIEDLLVSDRDKIRALWNTPQEPNNNEPYIPRTDNMRELWNTPQESSKYEVEIDTNGIKKKW